LTWSATETCRVSKSGHHQVLILLVNPF
jgi:hypothetical protein